MLLRMRSAPLAVACAWALVVSLPGFSADDTRWALATVAAAGGLNNGTGPAQQQLRQGPAARKVVAGDWRCCWGIKSCAAASNASCPAQLDPQLTGCQMHAACLGPCSRPQNKTLWCETAPRCPVGSKGCVSPPSTFDDPALRQPLRPPQQTPAQAAAMKKVYAEALLQSAAAKQYALNYMADILPSLDPTLQHLSPDELLQMFTWQFQRLPVFHNAPLDSWDVDRIGINDDSPLNITLSNGYIQQPCEREVLGGPQNLEATIMYGDMYKSHFDLPVKHLCDLTATLQKANDCLLFNANNLRRASIGNYEYGGMTFVLDAAKLSGRMLVEPIDGGLMTMLQWTNWRFWLNKFLFNFDWNTWVLGTLYPPAFYQLLQPHEAENKVMNRQYKNLAPIMNYWWVDGAPYPTPQNSGGMFLAYFEVMTDNIWLPEDLLAGIAKYANEPDQPGQYGAPGLWGTELGQQLRMWSSRHCRPLIWADREDGPMLLDPFVVSKCTGFSIKARAVEVAGFEVAWKLGVPWHPGSFDALTADTPKHFHFYWPSWQNRKLCEIAEQNKTLHVMGTNGDGDCVYWAPSPTPAAKFGAPRGWECLNDGTCVQSASSRAVYTSKSHCTTSCGASWHCLRSAAPNVSKSAVAYCLPRDTIHHDQMLQTVSSISDSVYNSLSSCQAECNSDDSDSSDRAFLCHDWEGIIVSTIWFLVVSSLLGLLMVCRIVGPRQQFRSGLSHCVQRRVSRRGNASVQSRPCCTCMFITCCPCFQWFRTMAFIYQCPRSCGGKCLAACCFSGFCLLNPCGIAAFCVCSTVCGACARYKLRQRLKIRGALWEDCLIHCFAGLCAMCQEALEITANGHSGIVYQHHDHQPCDAVVPLNPSFPASTAINSTPINGGARDHVERVCPDRTSDRGLGTAIDISPPKLVKPWPATSVGYCARINGCGSQMLYRHHTNALRVPSNDSRIFYKYVHILQKRTISPCRHALTVRLWHY
eukprot:SAG31_NODE_4035_length_3645_cov_1.508460_2_plen_982_part_00